MSVRTAWEIAALADVSLAPSPRQQRPAPARVCGRLLLSLPGAPAKDQALQTGKGHPHSWGRFSPALGCSVAIQPAAPTCGTQAGRERGSPGPSLFPAPAPGLCPAETAEPAPALPQPQEARRPWERVLSPSRPRAWRWGAPLRGREGEGRPRPHGTPAGTTLREGALRHNLQPGRPGHAGGQAPPQGHRPQEGRPWGPPPRSPSWSHRQGLAPIMSSGSVSSPHSPARPPPPPPDSPPTECLVERPWTEHLLAIQGGSQGPTGGQRGRRCWRPSAGRAGGRALSGQNLLYLVQKL